MKFYMGHTHTDVEASTRELTIHTHTDVEAFHRELTS